MVRIEAASRGRFVESAAFRDTTTNPCLEIPNLEQKNRKKKKKQLNSVRNLHFLATGAQPRDLSPWALLLQPLHP